MMDEAAEEMQKYLLDLLRQVSEINGYLAKNSELNNIFAKSIEALEKQFATMTVGFMEQAVMLEALITLIDDAEKQKKFQEYVQTRRAALLKVIEEGADALSRIVEDIADPMESVVSEDKPNSS